MARRQDSVALQIKGRQTLTIILSSDGKVDTRVGRRGAGRFAADKTTAQIVFGLADIVLLRRYRGTYALEPALKELSSLTVTKRGKAKRFRFARGRGIESVPDDLLLLVKEMSGLVPW